MKSQLKPFFFNLPINKGIHSFGRFELNLQMIKNISNSNNDGYYWQIGLIGFNRKSKITFSKFCQIWKKVTNNNNNNKLTNYESITDIICYASGASYKLSW